MKKWLTVLGFFLIALMSFHRAQGQVWVSGNVYEQDSVSPIVGASVVFSGVDREGDTLVYEFVTDTLGHYGDSIHCGTYWIMACATGYEPAHWMDSLLVEQDTIAPEYDTLCVVYDSLTGLYDTLMMVYDSLTGEYDTVTWVVDSVMGGIDLVLHELRLPVRYVAARLYDSDLMRISWSMHAPRLYEDFESGDLSRFDWHNGTSYPWTVDTASVFEGNYCMRSACEGVGNGLSQIEVPVYIPAVGKLRFYGKISSEDNWDVGCFYVDGVKKLEISGEEDWQPYTFDVTEGEHLFRWTYEKDASTDMGDDRFYVDAIHFYQEDTAASSETGRSFQYYDLFRRRVDEAPVMLASHLTDTMYMEMNWRNLPWGQYSWGVSCYYEGNRAASDTVWSVYLDKDMTTTLEVNVTTNIGLQPAGAVVMLSSHEAQGQSYQATADANGHVLMNHVYRSEYDLRVHLDGYMDYVSEEPLSIYAPMQIDVELSEDTLSVDSLYVSSTGWAIWYLKNEQDRDLQYFELKLNGHIIGQTTASVFQFDVSDLSDGELCVAEVRPVYLSHACAWHSQEWVYRSCSAFEGSSNGLQWSLHNDAVQLSWDYPDGADFLGAFVYRDGESLGFVEGNGFMDETVDMHNAVTYCIRLVHDGPMDGTYYAMACEECAEVVFPSFCDPPVKLEGTVYHDSDSNYGALISWGERPLPVNQWLHYDNGTFKRALGGDNEPIIFWSVRFDEEALSDYVGTSLKKVSLFDVGAGTYQLWVYVGGDTSPRTLVWSQNMTLNNTCDWHEESLSQIIEIPENEPIWIVVGQQGLPRPAAACADMGDADGRWVSLDGETWMDMNAFNMHYTWMLRAFVSNQSGRMLPLDREGYALQHYKLYRSNDNVDYQNIASITADESQVFYTYYDNLASVSSDYVYYRLTAYYLSDEGEPCESDYALTLDDPLKDYVVIDLCSTEEKEEDLLKLYPNPSNGLITIELHGMQQVTVTNVMGQVLLHQKVNADTVHLNLSDLDSGLYAVQVTTQNGVVTRPFVVSR